jgi:hypothetical protein
VALVKTDISEERIASIIRVTTISELGTTLAVTSNYQLFLRSVLQLLVNPNALPSSAILFTLKMDVIRSSETPVLIRATGRHIAEDVIRHSHRRENLKSYIALTSWTL